MTCQYHQERARALVACNYAREVLLRYHGSSADVMAQLCANGPQAVVSFLDSLEAARRAFVTFRSSTQYPQPPPPPPGRPQWTPALVRAYWLSRGQLAPIENFRNDPAW